MDEKKTIVHIGAAKCASTYLQSCVLPYVNGYKYVGKNNVQTKDILKKCIGKDSIQKKRFDRKVVISHEGLSVRKSIDGVTIAEKLMKCLGSCKILYVVRDQIEWLYSRYAQDVTSHMGDEVGYYDFSEWIRGDFHDAYSKINPYTSLYNPIKRIKYDKIIESYKSIGHDIHVLSLRDLKIDEVGFIKKIENLLGGHIKARKSKKRTNVRPSWIRLWVEKKMNAGPFFKNLLNKIDRLMPAGYTRSNFIVNKKVKKEIQKTNKKLRQKGIYLNGR
jgi:hypothetical protein